MTYFYRTRYKHFKQTFQKIVLGIAVVCAVVLQIGCGGSPPQPPIPITITEQPIDQIVPTGSTATFSIFASSAAALTYQWSQDGAAISGATASTYTTEPAFAGNSGSSLAGTYQVTVSNGTTSVTSNPVTLTIGPRSPKAGDLRYLIDEQVDVPGLQDTLITDIFAGITGNNADSSEQNAIGSPLKIMPASSACDPSLCAWSINYLGLPPGITGINTYYIGSSMATFTSDLQSHAAPNVIFYSLDIKSAEGVYGLAWYQTTQPDAGSFDYKLEVVPPAQVQAIATADGAASRIVTAAAFDANGNANLISYGWTGDTTTTYEAKTYLVPASQICTTASSLAQQGYFISAFGGDSSLGYMLIGMRVQGDTLPRPVYVNAAFPADTPPYPTSVVFYEGFGNQSLCSVNEE